MKLLSPSRMLHFDYYMLSLKYQKAGFNNYICVTTSEDGLHVLSPIEMMYSLNR